MMCPKCGRPMLPGYLQAGPFMAFNRRRRRLPVLGGSEPGAVQITHRLATQADFEGEICPDCELIVFRYTRMKARL